jgi:hypothetical protein
MIRDQKETGVMEIEVFAKGDSELLLVEVKL